MSHRILETVHGGTSHKDGTEQNRTEFRRINRKSHMRFRLVPKSLTLDDRERPIHRLYCYDSS